MRIEKKFYTDEAKLWRRVEEEEDRRKSGLLEEALEEENLCHELQAQELEKRAWDMQKDNYRVISQERLDRFQALTEMALALAEAAPMDIVVDTDHFFGQVRMKADCFMIMASSPAGMRATLSALISEAESVTIAPVENGLIEMQFIYPLCSEIPRTEG